MNKDVKAILILILVIPVVALIMSLPVKWIWNDLITDLFSLRRISFGEALELSLLCSILFKSTAASKKD